MTSQSDSSGSPRLPRARNRRVGWTVRISPSGILLFSVINLVILGGIAFGISRLMQKSGSPLTPLLPSETRLASIHTTSPSPTSTSTIQPSVTYTNQPSGTPSPEAATPSPQPISTLTLNQGLIILAVDEGGNTHLFAYQPLESGGGDPLPLTRLTFGPWDDINPAISPDGQTVAFASNRSGYWDIYLLTLENGAVTRLTDTLTYEASPSWSPDSQWLAYESYIGNNLDIEIQSVRVLTDTIQLTNGPAANFDPAWSPMGRQIAFVSNRSGKNEIWLADLDKAEDQRFVMISQNPAVKSSHPAWSPEGKSLVWVAEQDGTRYLFRQDFPANNAAGTPEAMPKPQNLGSGDWPAWSADGETILTILEAPNRTYLTAYPAYTPGLALPTIELPGAVDGLTWGNTTLGSTIQVIYQQAAQVSPTALYVETLSTPPADAGGRYQLVPLNNVKAPNPYLHDMVNDSFTALRNRIAIEAGWDFLASLDNAYVPLTSPLEPGMGNDWLYTGRAFATDTLPIDAGWMVVVRQDFGSDTYWRVYIRALYQDGSAGMPLHDKPWDFESRYNGDPSIYELGGKELDSIPEGYWIDFTERALAYGWLRLPTLITWRASYPAARFNEFVIPGDVDWQTAMLELYPAEALITPSPVVPPSRTPTATSRWYVSPTPTSTSTPRPTFTPNPTPGG